MKKTYIAPVALEHKIEPVNLIAESFKLFEDEVDGENALTEEDFGLMDDEEEDGGFWSGWKKN